MASYVYAAVSPCSSCRRARQPPQTPLSSPPLPLTWMMHVLLTMKTCSMHTVGTSAMSTRRSALAMAGSAPTCTSQPASRKRTQCSEWLLSRLRPLLDTSMLGFGLLAPKPVCH